MPLAPQAVQAGARLVSESPDALDSPAGDGGSLRLARKRGETAKRVALE